MTRQLAKKKFGVQSNVAFVQDEHKADPGSGTRQ